jgi:flagellar assembly protein FliH
MLIKNANSKTIAREAVVLDLGDLAAQGEVIKREAVASAQRTLREAREERARIVAGAEEEGRTRGFAEGRAKGVEEGRIAGRAEALAAESAALKSLQEKWGTALAAFESQREGLMIEARQSLLRLAASVARRVTKRHVEADRHVVAAQLEAALRMVLAPTKLVIEIDPSEVETARRAVPVLMERLGGSENADVRAREGLGAGSVIVRTDKGEIDASVRTQVERAVAALMGSDDQPDASEARLKGMADDDAAAAGGSSGGGGGS